MWRQPPRLSSEAEPSSPCTRSALPFSLVPCEKPHFFRKRLKLSAGCPISRVLCEKWGFFPEAIRIPPRPPRPFSAFSALKGFLPTPSSATATKSYYQRQPLTRMLSIIFLNWTPAPIPLHSGITSHTSSAAGPAKPMFACELCCPRRNLLTSLFSTVI